MGKSLWMNKTFKNAGNYYPVPDNNYPFEAWAGEDWIIYDDHHPSFIDFSSIANVWETPKAHVPGNSRFVKNNWKMNQARTVIVLTNQMMDYGKDQNAAHERFRIFHLKSPLSLTAEGNLQYVNEADFEELLY